MFYKNLSTEIVLKNSFSTKSEHQSSIKMKKSSYYLPHQATTHKNIKADSNGYNQISISYFYGLSLIF